MAEVTYKTIFKFKRGTSEAWTIVNPTLAEGEPGFELDTGKLKTAGSCNKALSVVHTEASGLHPEQLQMDCGHQF